MPRNTILIRTHDDLLTLREGWDFEAKEAQGRDGRGALPDSFWQTYSAMANTDGGVIVLGLRERPEGSMKLLGLRDPAKVERDLWNLLDNRRKISANVLQRRHVQPVRLAEKQLLVIEVPRAPRTQRPVYLGADPFAGTYVRTHEGDRHADRERVRRMLADSDIERPADSVVLEGSRAAAERRWDDRLIPDGTWNANLLQFYWQVYPKLVEGLPGGARGAGRLRCASYPPNVA